VVDVLQARDRRTLAAGSAREPPRRVGVQAKKAG
jgi:hypothetical protein